MLPPFLFALAVDIFTEFANESVLSECVYADDLVLLCEGIILSDINVENGDVLKECK